MRKFLGFAALLLCALPAFAQTSQPSGEPFAITGALASSSSNALTNGVQSTFEYTVKPRTDDMLAGWSLRVDDITTTAGQSINLGEAQWKIPASDALGKSFASASAFKNVLIGIHGGLGAVKAAGTGSASFAVGAGLTVDYQVTNVFFVRVVDLTDVYSRGLNPANQVFGNYNNLNVGSGIGFSF
jgi:hypothetical protein